MAKQRRIKNLIGRGCLKVIVVKVDVVLRYLEQSVSLKVATPAPDSLIKRSKKAYVYSRLYFFIRLLSLY